MLPDLAAILNPPVEVDVDSGTPSTVITHVTVPPPCRRR
jgi:hypothetical protein